MNPIHLSWILPYTGIAAILMNNCWDDKELTKPWWGKPAIVLMGALWLPYYIVGWFFYRNETLDELEE